jgi:anaerobic selenocysteine-containing dehydrogenase
MVVYQRSVCPHDCPDTCGLVVGVEDGRVVSVKGDPDHPFTRVPGLLLENWCEARNPLPKPGS